MAKLIKSDLNTFKNAIDVASIELSEDGDKIENRELKLLKTHLERHKQSVLVINHLKGYLDEKIKYRGR